MTGGVLGTSQIEVNALPVAVGLLANQSFVVVRVHIAQIVGR